MDLGSACLWLLLCKDHQELQYEHDACPHAALWIEEELLFGKSEQIQGKLAVSKLTRPVKTNETDAAICGQVSKFQETYFLRLISQLETVRS